MTMTTDQLLVDAKAAAKTLAISTRSLWTLTNMGEIPCIRINRSVRYSIDDLRDYIDSQRSRKPIVPIASRRWE